MITEQFVKILLYAWHLGSRWGQRNVLGKFRISAIYLNHDAERDTCVKIHEVFLENLELDAKLQIPHHDGLALS